MNDLRLWKKFNHIPLFRLSHVKPLKFTPVNARKITQITQQWKSGTSFSC